MISNISLPATGCLIEEILGSSLLDKKTGHIECTQAVRKVVEIATDSINALLKGSLSTFDANACDQACHVRAIRTAMVAKKLLQQQTLLENTKEQLAALKGRVEHLLSSLTTEGNVKNTSIRALYQQKQITLPLPSDLIYLTQAKLLTDSREVTPVERPCECHGLAKGVKEITKPELLLNANEQQSKALSALMKRVVSDNKENLSKHSVNFLVQHASPEVQTELLAGQVVIKKRTEVPCLTAINALIEIAKTTSIPICVRVRKASHLFEGLDDPYDTMQFTGVETPADQEPIIVVDGQRFGVEEPTEVYHARLQEYPLEELIQLNAAQHPQYSDQKIALPSKPELEKLQQKISHLAKKAVEIGASYKNQTLFAITHIYSSTIKELQAKK